MHLELTYKNNEYNFEHIRLFLFMVSCDCIK